MSPDTRAGASPKTEKDLGIKSNSKDFGKTSPKRIFLRLKGI
jgi:hypothetical protein